MFHRLHTSSNKPGRGGRGRGRPDYATPRHLVISSGMASTLGEMFARTAGGRSHYARLSSESIDVQTDSIYY